MLANLFPKTAPSSEFLWEELAEEELLRVVGGYSQTVSVSSGQVRVDEGVPGWQSMKFFDIYADSSASDGTTRFYFYNANNKVVYLSNEQTFSGEPYSYVYDAIPASRRVPPRAGAQLQM